MACLLTLNIFERNLIYTMLYEIKGIQGNKHNNSVDRSFIIKG